MASERNLVIRKLLSPIFRRFGVSRPPLKDLKKANTMGQDRLENFDLFDIHMLKTLDSRAAE